MSYNADDISVVKSDGFCIPRPKWESLARKFRDEAPEASCLAEDWPSSNAEDHRGMLFANEIDWTGEGSGHTWDIFTVHVLPAFLGSVDLVVTWEGGDSHSGLRLENGVVTEHEVVMALGKVKP